MPLKIPISYQDPLRELLTMEAASRHRLVHAIRAAGAVVDPGKLISRVKDETQLDEKIVGPIIWMLISMVRASEYPGEGFVQEVIEAAKSLGQVDGVDWAAVSEDLAQLLGSDESLGVTAKVEALRREYPKVFCRARVLTDIRPVFGEEPARGPLAAAIVHTLRISYHEGERGDHREFYVALDAADLRQVREVVDRAVRKEGALKAELQKTSVKCLPVEMD